MTQVGLNAVDISFGIENFPQGEDIPIVILVNGNSKNPQGKDVAIPSQGNVSADYTVTLNSLEQGDTVELAAQIGGNAYWVVALAKD